VTRTEHPTSIVFALDLTLLIHVMSLGAIWLLQRKPWGYILAGISTVKGPAYTLVLTSGSLWAANAGVPGTTAELPIWIFLTVIGVIAGLLLFGNMDTAK
jgi:heme/copper-type cytochrome/quinol oxidase subunit 4